jgi:WD40-like Beta Propeller Repeat
VPRASRPSETRRTGDIASRVIGVVRASSRAVVVLVAAFATGCGGHGRASGTIVLESSFSGRAALYSVRPDGTGVTKLAVDLPADGADIAWTRDGTKALVEYDTGTGGTVAYVFEPTSHTRRAIQLRGLYWISDMPWSPDGTRLVLGTGNGDVVLDVKDGNRQPIDTANADQLVTWSGDGEQLLFTSGLGVYAAPAAGGSARAIVALARRGVVGLFGLQSSADGKWISFIANGETRTVGLYAVRSNGTGLRLIARDAESSAWSPTGNRVAFARENGVAVVDVEHGRRRQLTTDRLDDPTNEPPAWSPDGRWILYRRNDLGFGAPLSSHLQLWAMKSDGTDKHPLTNGFAIDLGDEQAVWVEASVEGRPAPGLPLVVLRPAPALTTGLPIAALAAEGNEAAVAQGFGGMPGLRGPLGPIVVWNRVRGTRVFVSVHGCGSVFDVLLAEGRVGYRCDNAGNGYTVDDSLRLGTTELVRTHGEEFTGSFLGGVAADGGTVAFDVASAGSKIRGDLVIQQTRVWKATESRKSIVRTFRGEATVAALDASRIAVVRGGKAISVLASAGGVRTFRFGGRRVLGAGLAGPRLVALLATRLTVVDLRSGRRAHSWPVRRGFGPAPELEGAQGDLAAYVVGASIHVLRLHDGREIVINTPNATEPVFARFVASGLFYSFNAAYEKRPGRLVFVVQSQLEHALNSKAAAR